MTDYEQARHKARLHAKFLIKKYGNAAAREWLIGLVDEYLAAAHQLNPPKGKPAIKVYTLSNGEVTAVYPPRVAA